MLPLHITLQFPNQPPFLVLPFSISIREPVLDVVHRQRAKTNQIQNVARHVI